MPALTRVANNQLSVETQRSVHGRQMSGMKLSRVLRHFETSDTKSPMATATKTAVEHTTTRTSAPTT
jgi:hypothetical protein